MSLRSHEPLRSFSPHNGRIDKHLQAKGRESQQERAGGERERERERKRGIESGRREENVGLQRAAPRRPTEKHRPPVDLG